MIASVVRLERGKLGFIRYVNITARATRSALREDERVKAERRDALAMKYQVRRRLPPFRTRLEMSQMWSGGKGGEQKFFREPVEEK